MSHLGHSPSYTAEDRSPPMSIQPRKRTFDRSATNTIQTAVETGKPPLDNIPTLDYIPMHPPHSEGVLMRRKEGGGGCGARGQAS